MKHADWRFGNHAVEAALNAGEAELLVVSNQHRRRTEFEKLAKRRGVPLERLDLAELAKRFKDARHQGIACRVQPIPYRDDAWLAQRLEGGAPILLLVLDQIQDPRNFGACLRTAEAAGVAAVIFPKDRSAEVTAVAAQAAAGAASRLPLVRVTNLAACLDLLKQANVWLTGAEAAADRRLDEIDLTGRTAIVMGNEGRGLRRLTRERCDFLAAIPMAGDTESLNVSVATGIFLFEAVRQRIRELS